MTNPMHGSLIRRIQELEQHLHEEKLLVRKLRMEDLTRRETKDHRKQAKRVKFCTKALFQDWDQLGCEGRLDRLAELEELLNELRGRASG